MEDRIVKNKFLRVLLKICGFLAVLLGVIGAILPIIPTTPFLILAAICFSYSSESFYHKVTTNKYFGKNVRDYLEGRGIPMKAKLAAVGGLLLSIGLSIWIVKIFWLKLVLVLVTILVIIYILMQPNANQD